MKKALFLDRDGVINVEKEYLYKIEDFEFIDGIFELCRHYKELGYLVVVVTNQSGIARGFYTEDDFEKLTSWMKERFLDASVEIDGVYHCPHHPDITGECECRKPKPGMLFDAKRDLDIDLDGSLLVGDKQRDIQAAINAGVKESYLFDEKGSIKDSKATKTVTNLKDIYAYSK